MNTYIASAALVLLGMVAFILWDLAYNPRGPKVRALKYLDLRRYFNTNQMRLLTLLIGGIVFAAFIVLIKEWVDALVAQIIAVLGGVAGTLANKKMVDKNSMTRGLPGLYSIAVLEDGVSEIKGARHNERIVQYAKEGGFPWVNDDETPWCAIFMNWVIWRSGRKGTGSAAARSFLTYGVEGKIENAPDGNLIGVFKRGNSPTAGHVGIIIGEEGNHYFVFGGNQSNKACTIKISKFDLLSMRKPE